MKADAQIEPEVVEVMKRYNEAYAERDVDGVVALFAPDPDVVIIGTGEEGKRIGLNEIKAQLERDFTQSQAASIEFIWYSVSSEDSVAWIAADCIAHVNMAGGKEITLPVRSTAVLEQRAGRWLIVQSHASIPSVGQSEGESFPK